MTRAFAAAALIVAAMLTGDVPRAHTEQATSDVLTRFLPQERNKKLCFAAEFVGATVNLTERREEPSEHKLESLTAQLYWDDAEPLPYDNGNFGHDRRYEMLIAALVAQRGSLFGGLECPFRARDMADPQTGQVFVRRNTDELHCFQDCEGGNLAVGPAPDGAGLMITFRPGDWMRVGGCGGRRSIRFEPGYAHRVLRLSPAPARACQPINEHYKIDP